jgi:hypothetical protein
MRNIVEMVVFSVLALFCAGVLGPGFRNSEMWKYHMVRPLVWCLIVVCCINIGVAISEYGRKQYEKGYDSGLHDGAKISNFEPPSSPNP